MIKILPKAFDPNFRRGHIPSGPCKHDIHNKFGARSIWSFWPGNNPAFGDGAFPGSSEAVTFQSVGHKMDAKLKNHSPYEMEAYIEPFHGGMGYTGLVANLPDNDYDEMQFNFGTGAKSQIPFPSYNNLTVWALFRPKGRGTQGAADPRVISRDNGTSSSDHYYMLGGVRSGGSDTRARLRFKIDGTTVTVIGDQFWQQDALNLVVGSYDGRYLVLHHLREDGSYEESGIGYATSGGLDDTTDASVGMAIGSNFTGANNFEGEILGVGAFDYAMDTEHDVREFMRDVTQILAPIQPPLFVPASEPSGLTPVSNTLQFDWHSIESVNGSKSFLWGLLNNIANQNSIDWNTLNSVLSSNSLAWSLVESVGSAKSLEWNALNNVLNTTQLDWNMLNGVGNAAQFDWSLINNVLNTTQLDWNMLNGVGASKALEWSIYNSVSTALDIDWNALNSVLTNREVKWSIFNQVVNGVDIDWDVLSALVNVIASVQTDWSLLQDVTASTSVDWSLLNNATTGVELKFNLLNQISQNLDLDWNLVAQVNQTTQFRWDIFAATGTVSSNLMVGWDVLSSIEQSLASQWHLLEAVNISKSLRWQIAQAVQNTIQANWSLLQDVGKGIDVTWDTLTIVDGGVQLEWTVDGEFVRLPVVQMIVTSENRIATILDEDRIMIIT